MPGGPVCIRCYYKFQVLDKGGIAMRKSVYAAIIVALLLCFPGAAFAWFNPDGWWLLEGDGYAERHSRRVELDSWGELFIRTDGRYVTGYDVWVTLHAPRFNIIEWDYSVRTTLWNPVRLPAVPPTRHEPFRLPRVTHGGLTYDVELTSATSGTIWIYGQVSGGVFVNSLSDLWKEYTQEYLVPVNGCNAGLGAAALLVAALFLAQRFRKRT